MSLLTTLKLIHLVGLMMGFGGAILADFLVLKRAILTPIQKQTIESVRHLSHVVLAGLAILWISGAGLVYVRYAANPDFLMNEKIWAKVTIVAILTINGFAVHNIALSYLQSRVGKQMFSPDVPRTMIGLTFVAAVSSVSWFVPFVLGTASEFNFTVPAVAILGVYAIMVVGAWCAFYGLAQLVSESDSVHDQHANEQVVHRAALLQRVGQLSSRPSLITHAESNAHMDLPDYVPVRAEKLTDIIRRLEQSQSELNSTPVDGRRQAA